VGEPFGMFDFSPVGIVASVVGVLFIALVGWRLIPADATKDTAGDALDQIQEYVAEVRVGEKSNAIDQRIRDLDQVECN